MFDEKTIINHSNRESKQHTPSKKNQNNKLLLMFKKFIIKFALVIEVSNINAIQNL